jgi:hypothetical protein
MPLSLRGVARLREPAASPARRLLVHAVTGCGGRVDAPDAAFALVLLPPYVAARSTGEPIRELLIP